MYRTIDTCTWDDPWVTDLRPLDKLLFFYLLTNRRSTACGVFEITVNAMSFETGLSSKQVTEGLVRLEPKILWWPAHRVVFVRNFFKHQCAQSNRDTFTTAAAKKLLEYPPEVQATVVSIYPSLYKEDTVPPPTPQTPPTVGGKETVTVTVTEAATGAVTVTKRARKSPPVVAIDNVTAAFAEFWQAYPRDKDGMRPGSNSKALAEFRKISVSDWDTVMAGLEKYKTLDKVLRGYVLNAETWLKEGKWRDAIAAQPLPEVKTNGTHQQQPSKRQSAIANGFEGAFGVPLEQVFGGRNDEPFEDDQAGNVRRFPSPRSGT